MKTPDKIKRKLITCTELNMPQDVQHRAMLDALALIRQLEAQAPRWISVKERLPEKYLRVLGVCCMGVFEMMYDGKYWRIYELPFEDTVTHWMPLPEPPKEGTERHDKSEMA